MNTVKVRYEGISPLIMHNGQLADPLNKFSKELKKLSGKRKKVDSDYEEMGRVEWYGSLYINEDGKPCLPGRVLEANIIEGAKVHKLGTAFQGTVWVDDTADCAF